MKKLLALFSVLLLAVGCDKENDPKPLPEAPTKVYVAFYVEDADGNDLLDFDSEPHLQSSPTIEYMDRLYLEGGVSRPISRSIIFDSPPIFDYTLRIMHNYNGRHILAFGPFYVTSTDPLDEQFILTLNGKDHEIAFEYEILKNGERTEKLTGDGQMLEDSYSLTGFIAVAD